MTWGPQMMYYVCPKCGHKFKYELNLLPRLGPEFGRCPICGAEGTFVKDGPRTLDQEYTEVFG